MLQLFGPHKYPIHLSPWIITSQPSHLLPLKYAQCRINLCLMQLFLTKAPFPYSPLAFFLPNTLTVRVQAVPDEAVLEEATQDETVPSRTG